MNLKVFLFIASAIIHLCAQDMPKIGLALSGGGAKGLAHIGVIKVLEEENIPIDYITGTSMGSIIGALYAIGYGPEAMEKVLTEVNWDNIFFEKVERHDLPMELKQYDGRYMLSLPIKGNKLTLPSAVMGDFNISMLFSRLTLPVHHIDDFNEFPIPFACIAADITTGEVVVLNSGSLAEAMRASMSLPMVFSPIKINDRLLVDGGILRNFPVQDVINMGADIVIGVDVGAPLYKEDELDSFIKILDQASGFKGAESTIYQRELCDLLIAPDTEGISLLDFGDVHEIINRGEQAARKLLPQIRALADSTTRRTGYISDRSPSIPDTVIIQKITIEGSSHLTSRVIKSELNIDPPQKISMQNLEYKINRIYSTQTFDKIRYYLYPDNNGFELVLKYIEDKDILLRSSLRYESYTDAAILLNIFSRKLGGLGSFLNIDIRLGERVDADINYFAHLAWLPTLGVSARLHYADTFVDVFRNGSRKAKGEIKSLYGEGLFGSVFSTRLVIGLGMRAEYTYVKSVIAESDTIPWDAKLYPLVNVIWYDNLDRTYFSTSGVSLFMRNEWVPAGFGVEEYFRVHFLKFHGRIPAGKKISFFTEIMLSGKSGADLPPHYEFILGGVDLPAMAFARNFSFISFMGLEYQELKGPFAQFAQIGIQGEITSNLFLILRANSGNVFSEWNSDFSINRFKHGIGLTLGYLSVMGPVELTFMSGSGHKFLSHFNLGFKF